MARTIIVDAEEKVACPKCSHRFPLSEGISRQAIERHAAELERALAEAKKKLEAQLAAEAKAQFDTQLKALNEVLSAKEGTLDVHTVITWQGRWYITHLRKFKK